MFNTKKSLNNYTAEVDRLLSAPDWDFSDNAQALAVTTDRMATLKRNILQGMPHCHASAAVQQLAKNIDYAQCFLISAEYFQKQIARATEASAPPYEIEELNRCNKRALESAAKNLNESRPLWKEIKTKHFTAARARDC